MLEKAQILQQAKQLVLLADNAHTTDEMWELRERVLKLAPFGSGLSMELGNFADQIEQMINDRD